MINLLKRLLGITALELKLARAEELIHDLAAAHAILVMHVSRKDRQIIELTEEMALREGNIH